MKISSEIRGQRYEHDEMQECLEVLRKEFSATEIIHRAGNRTIVRWCRSPESDPIIIKMWARPGAISLLRRNLNFSPSDIECRNLRLAGALGIPVPNALGSCAISPGIEGNTDAIFMEDLGTCTLATDYLKDLIAANRELEVLQFEDATIDMAGILVRAGMLDVDHGFANMLVRKSGQPVRVDLELMRPLKGKTPASIYELAKLLSRDFKNVYEDVIFLSELGIIGITESKTGRKQKKPTLLCDNILFELAA